MILIYPSEKNEKFMPLSGEISLEHQIKEREKYFKEKMTE